MWRLPALLAIAAALLAAQPASADERLIAPEEAWDVSAYRGWVMWNTSDGPVLWRAGDARPFAPAGTGASGPQRARLGSDTRGRSAVSYLACAEALERSRWRDCAVRQQRLAGGAPRTLLSAGDSNHVGVPEVWLGSLALSFVNTSTPAPRLQLFPPGRRALRLTREAPFNVDMESGRLVYAGHREYAWPGFNTVARAIDLRGDKPRMHTLARHDGEDEDGRTGATVVRLGSGATDGRYAYWVRTALSSSNSAYELWRADLSDPAATVRKAPLSGPVSSLAVNGGRIYCTGESRGVYEITDPAWQDTGLRTPLRD